MTKMTIGVNPIGAIYKTVPTMHLTLYGSLKLIVSPDLGVLFFTQHWWDIIFPSSFL